MIGIDDVDVCGRPIRGDAQRLLRDIEAAARAAIAARDRAETLLRGPLDRLESIERASRDLTERRARSERAVPGARTAAP